MIAPGLTFGKELVDDLAALPFPDPSLAAADAGAWCTTVQSSLGALAAQPVVSSVSRRAIGYIERHIDEVPRLGDAATTVGVSPTRLTHLFTKEVGIPFRRFVLWTRIKRAVTAFQAGDDLTRAAVTAGFTDSAHFSRTFRSMFGLSPSGVLPVAEVVGEIWRDP
jgi:AraC-like DNA-binding protein